MKILFYILILCIVLTGCASETQQKAINEIAQIYGGKISYSKGFASSTEKGNVKRFNVTLENSALFENGIDRKGVVGNIGVILYDNFSEEERSDYDEIKIELNGDNSQISESFSMEQLKNLSTYQKIVTGHLNSILEGNYQKLHESLYEKVSMPMDSLELAFSPLQQKGGNLVKITNLYSKEIKYSTAEQKDIPGLTFEGRIEKTEKKFWYKMTFDPAFEKTNIITLRYEEQTDDKK